MHRIHDFIITDKAEIASMFRPFDSSLTILDFSLMKESISNTGYAVTTNAGKAFSGIAPAPIARPRSDSRNAAGAERPPYPPAELL